MDPCPFCIFNEVEAVLHNEVCYARFDKYPVNRGHLLLLPRRHVPTWFWDWLLEQANKLGIQ